MNEHALLASGRRTQPVAGAAISVIVPTCDRPDYLREALTSVLAQTLPPGELLVIDNGTGARDEAQWHPLIRHYRLAPRVGPSRVRNFGAAMALGDYLAFLDDDDWWEPDFLREAVAVMAREQARCVYGRKVASRDGTVSPYKLASREDLTIATLLRRNPGTGGMNLVIERQLYLELGGFDERLFVSEDRALALEMLLAGVPMAIAPDAVAVVRQHDAERLRRQSLRKLGFVWKYRRLHTPAGLIAAISRIVGRALWPWHRAA